MNASPIRRAIIAVLLPFLAAVVELALDRLVGANAWLVPTFVAVVIVAWAGGWGAGLLAVAVTLALDAAVPYARLAASLPVESLRVPIEIVNGLLAVAFGTAVRASELRARTTAAMRDVVAEQADETTRRGRIVEAVVAELVHDPSPLQVADLVVRQVGALTGGDARVGVDILGADGTLVPVAASGDGHRTGPAAMDRRRPDDLVAGALDSREVRHAGARAACPLLAGDQPVGVITIERPPAGGRRPSRERGPGRLLGGSGASDGRPDPGLDAIVLAIGRLAGSAIERHGLLGDRRRSVAAASAALARIDRLTRLSAALAGASSTGAIARAVVEESMAALGAAVGLFYVTDQDGTLILVEARGYPPGLARAHARLAADSDLPVAIAARDGRAVEIAGPDRWQPVTGGAADVLGITGTRSLVARPIASPGADAPEPSDGDAREPGATVPVRATAAVLVLQRAVDGPLGEADRELLDAMADQAAQALDRTRLYEALRDRDRRLGLTLAASRTGTWELDVATDHLVVSDEFRRIHGLASGETPVGRSGLARLVSGDDRPRFRTALDRAVESGSPFELDYRVERRDGTPAWAHVVGRGFSDDDASPGGIRRVMGVARETTIQVLAEAERDRLLDQEREARRLQEAFIGIISHELRTPITTLLAGTKLLARQPGLAEIGIELVADVESEADRLYRLVEDLLVLSRLERGNLEIGREPVHVGHLAERVVASERSRWPETRFVVERARDLLVVRGEETYVEQVLRNFVTNAAKYSPPGTTVRVRLESDSRTVSVRVLDEGPGIEGEEADQLFSLFYRSPRTAATASGAGIGLFVCQRLVGAMGGRTWAARRPEGGSEFGFALAAYEEDEIEPPAGRTGTGSDRQDEIERSLSDAPEEMSDGRADEPRRRHRRDGALGLAG